MQAPKQVRNRADDLGKATGHPPVIEQVRPDRWRVTMANDRVTMTIDYKPTNGRPPRWVWASSELYIDGVRQDELTNGFEHFVRVFKDPDEFKNPHPTPVPLDTPLDEVSSLDDLPSMVRKSYLVLADKLGDDAVTVGRSRSYWVLQVVTGDATMRVNLIDTSGHGEWELDHQHPIQLVIGGRDFSDEVEGNIERAMGLIMKPAHQAAPGNPPVAGPAPAARSNAVETRRQTVIRQ